ncbi:hypothetical protein [Streptomyces sp. NBC_00439]|uniref:hypothetical protein n=1 Tax=Streptomyces sp. NBC_00439 TaxID=2903650 RepID=UPI0022564C99|nr:hypothetical protein [Streptomyces sp. NBC_00439]MCX5103522.1 hypothetical protein [Streptomyces sp. NBC_00439]
MLDGTPVFLDGETQMPVPQLCEYGRYLSTALLDETTLKDYGRAVGRLDAHLAIGALRIAGTQNVAAALRANSRDPKRPLALLGLT